MLTRTSIACSVALSLCASPVLAHGTTAGDLPLVSGTLQLHHRSSAEIVALFGREQPGATPRAARAGTPGALLPQGIDGLLRSGEHGLTVVGFEPRFGTLVECLEVIDVPVEQVGERARVTLTLRRASGRDVRARLRGAGTVEASGRRLTLEGAPGWLHQALRRVIEAELGLAAPVAPLTP